MRIYCPYEYTTPDGEVKVEAIVAPIASFVTRPTKQQIEARLQDFFAGLPESARPAVIPEGFNKVISKYTV